jgi:hypothetical protein
VLDGVYRRSAEVMPEFVEVAAPTDEALQALLHRIITRLMKLLTCRGVLVEVDGSTYMADNSCNRWSSCSGWRRWCQGPDCT